MVSETIPASVIKTCSNLTWMEIIEPISTILACFHPPNQGADKTSTAVSVHQQRTSKATLQPAAQIHPSQNVAHSAVLLSLPPHFPLPANQTLAQLLHPKLDRTASSQISSDFSAAPTSAASASFEARPGQSFCAGKIASGHVAASRKRGPLDSPIAGYLILYHISSLKSSSIINIHIIP